MSYKVVFWVLSIIGLICSFGCALSEPSADSLKSPFINFETHVEGSRNVIASRLLLNPQFFHRVWQPEPNNKNLLPSINIPSDLEIKQPKDPISLPPSEDLVKRLPPTLTPFPYRMPRLPTLESSPVRTVLTRLPKEVVVSEPTSTSAPPQPMQPAATPRPLPTATETVIAMPTLEPPSDSYPVPDPYDPYPVVTAEPELATPQPSTPEAYP